MVIISRDNKLERQKDESMVGNLLQIVEFNQGKRRDDNNNNDSLK